jgi:glutamate-1-semialdehyde aminotransferase
MTFSLPPSLPGEAPSHAEIAWLTAQGVYERSRENFALWERNIAHIIGGGQAHKRPVKYLLRGGPAFAARAKGSRFWDVDGREFLDYLLGYGPIVLGHADDEISAAVFEQIGRGTIFSVESPLAIDLAEELCRIIPCAELATFCIGGSSANVAAIRYARTHTKREKVLRCGYHGWFDWCFPEDPGAPKFYRDLISPIPFNDLKALESALAARKDEVAAVIIEVNPEQTTAPGYFAGVRSLCDTHGCVFILDEVKTGFRYALGGAQEYYQIDPDIAVYGKALGNGFPISAVVGKRKILEARTDTFVGATFHGDPVSMTAALATIKALRARNGIAHLWRLGNRLMDGMNSIMADLGLPMTVKGQAPMPTMLQNSTEDILRPMPLNWKGKMFGYFFGALQRRGIYMTGHCWFLSVSHTDADIDETLRITKEAGVETLEMLERFEGKAQVKS